MDPIFPQYESGGPQGRHEYGAQESEPKKTTTAALSALSDSPSLPENGAFGAVKVKDVYTEKEIWVHPGKMEYLPEESPIRKHNDEATIDRVLTKEYRLVLDPSKVEASLQKQLKEAQRDMDKEPPFGDFRRHRASFINLQRYSQLRSDWQSKDWVAKPWTRIEKDSSHSSGISETKGARSANEDSHAVAPFEFQAGGETHKAFLTAVYDGHNDKAKCSGKMAESFSEQLRLRLEEFSREGLTDLGIYNALKIAMVDMSIAYPYDEEGSTANVVVRIGDVLWTANTGDARAFVLDPKGNPTQLSDDADLEKLQFANRVMHEGLKRFGPNYSRGKVISKESFDDLMFKDKKVTINDSRVTSEGPNMARSIGDHGFFPYMSARPKITRYPLENGGKGYTLVQTCDGVYEVATTRQVANLVREMREEGEGLKEIAANIVTSAFLGGSNDNITAIVTDLDPDYQSPSPPEVVKGQTHRNSELLRQQIYSKEKQGLGKAAIMERPLGDGECILYRVPPPADAKGFAFAFKFVANVGSNEYIRATLKSYRGKIAYQSDDRIGVGGDISEYKTVFLFEDWSQFADAIEGMFGRTLEFRQE